MRLRVVEGQPAERVADRMGVTEDVVRARVSRGLRDAAQAPGAPPAEDAIAALPTLQSWCRPSPRRAGAPRAADLVGHWIASRSTGLRATAAVARIRLAQASISSATAEAARVTASIAQFCSASARAEQQLLLGGPPIVDLGHEDLAPRQPPQRIDQPADRDAPDPGSDVAVAAIAPGAAPDRHERVLQRLVDDAAIGAAAAERRVSQGA